MRTSTFAVLLACFCTLLSQTQAFSFPKLSDSGVTNFAGRKLQETTSEALGDSQSRKLLKHKHHHAPAPAPHHHYHHHAPAPAPHHHKHHHMAPEYAMAPHHQKACYTKEEAEMIQSTWPYEGGHGPELVICKKEGSGSG